VKGKILLACNDDACRNKLLELFEGKSLTIQSVWNEPDLLLEILDTDYDAIIYDLELSDFDGVKMVRIIRRIRPKVALIVISTQSSTHFGGKVLQEGVAYFAVKPINHNAVYVALQKALNNK